MSSSNKECFCGCGLRVKGPFWGTLRSMNLTGRRIDEWLVSYRMIVASGEGDADFRQDTEKFIRIGERHRNQLLKFLHDPDPLTAETPELQSQLKDEVNSLKQSTMEWQKAATKWSKTLNKTVDIFGS